MLTAFIYLGLTILIGFGLHATTTIIRRRQSEQAGSPVLSGRVVMYGIFMLVGLGFGLFGWNIAVSADDESADWSKADGQITLFEDIDEAVIYDRGFSFSGDVTEPLHLVLLSYEYTVDDTLYTGDKILTGEQLNNGFHEFEEEELTNYREKYATGTAVEVLYNPDDPSEAALETTDNTALLAIGIGAGVLFGLVAGVFAFPVMQFFMNRPEGEENSSSSDEE